MNKRYIFEIHTVAEQSNFSVDDCTVNDWRFSWNNNNICAIIYAKNFSKNHKQMGDGFEYLNTPDKLGLLVDSLSFVTELPVSCKMDFRLYQLENNIKIDILDKTIPLAEILRKVRANKMIEHGSSVNEWPIRIDPNMSHTFNDEAINFKDYLLKLLSSLKIKSTSIKLLNYWRKGFDLDQLNYWDESFLIFFKILEYFDKKYQPNRNSLIDNEIIKTKSDIRKKALRIIGGAEVNNIKEYLLNLISDCIKIRNNFDVAHMRIKPLPKGRDGALYFTYYLNVWDTHDHIKELSRLFIYKQLGIKNVQLKSDGGLFRLAKI